jgi:hypothetical protein
MPWSRIAAPERMRRRNVKLEQYPPDRLAPETRAGLLVQQAPDGTDFVTVRLDVKLRDVWLIAEIVGGVAQSWFSEPEVMVERKLAFAHEQEAWLRETASRNRPS